MRGRNWPSWPGRHSWCAIAGSSTSGKWFTARREAWCQRGDVKVPTPAAYELTQRKLVALAPDILVGHTTPGTRALRRATSSIPIVMVAVNDPVEQGFVSSLAHPGGNITGFTLVDF